MALHRVICIPAVIDWTLPSQDSTGIVVQAGLLLVRSMILARSVAQSCQDLLSDDASGPWRSDSGALAGPVWIRRRARGEELCKGGTYLLSSQKAPAIIFPR
jgi:hypothetical protein